METLQDLLDRGSDLMAATIAAMQNQSPTTLALLAVGLLFVAFIWFQLRR